MKKITFFLFFILSVISVDISGQCVTAGPAMDAICQGGTSAALGGSFIPDATSAVWSCDDAGGTFANNGGSTPDLATYTASASAPPVVNLTLTAHGGTCEGTIVTKQITVASDPAWDVYNLPSPTALCEGGSVSFDVSVTGGLGGTITWIRSGTSGGAGTTVTSPDYPDAGTWYYRPHYAPDGDGCNLTDGTETTVVVSEDPAWTGYSLPSPTALCEGGSVSFDVSVTGGLGGTITWIRSGTSGGAGTTVTSPDYPDAGTWYYRPHYAPDGDGCNLADGTETEVIVDETTGGTANGSNQTICYGATPSDVVVVGSLGNVLNWEKDDNPTFPSPDIIGVPDVTLPGATIGMLNETSYFRAIVQNGLCSVEASGYAKITVHGSLSASITGGASEVCFDGSPGELTAVGSGGDGSFTYQWYNTSTGLIAGATSDKFTPLNLTSDIGFYCELNSTCGIITTATKWITVYPTLTAGISGGSSPICNNTSPGTFTAAPSGGTGTYAYLWYRNGMSTGVTTPTYTPTLTETSDIYCAVISGPCGPVNTTTTNITVYGPLTASVTPGNSTICYSTSPGTFTVTPSGGTGSYSYQWYSTESGLIAGATGSTYNPGDLAVTNGFYCRVTSGSCGFTDSPASTITVRPNLTASVSGGTSPVCFNTSPGTFTASGAGGTGSYTYQWYTTAGSIAGATDPTYNPGNITATTGYYCAVTSGTCGTAVTSTTTITVYGNLTAGISGGTSPVCYNDNPGTLTANPSGGTGAYTYQWYSTSGIITGATDPTYDPGNIILTTGYFCEVTSGSCGTVTTPTTTIIVRDNLTATISGGASPVCYNTSPGVFIATGDGGTGSYTYQWYTTTGIIAGATGQTYNPGNITATTGYYCAITSGSCGTVNTAVTSITVYDNFTANISGGITPICYNTSPGTLTATGTGGAGVYSYQWYSTTTGLITGATNPTYSPGNLTSTTGYYCKVTSGSCGTVNTPTTTITVYNNFSVSISGGTSPICFNTSPGTFTASGTGGIGSYSYQWYSTVSGLITGATNSTYNPGDISSTTGYYCEVTSGSCGTLATSTVNITVRANLTATISGGSSPICYNTSPGTFTAAGSGGIGVYSYQWYNTTGLISGATSSTYSPGNITASTGYYCEITSGSCGTVNTSTTSITVYDNLTAAISGGTSPILYNESPGILTASGGGGTGTYSYLWYKDGASTGISTDTYDPGNLTSTHSFYCAITSGLCGSVNTATTVITVNALPVASNISILGEARSGMTLNAAYLYSDADNDDEGTSQYQWYTGTSSAGDESAPIPLANSLEYRITDGELTKFIGFSVTPIAQTGSNPGNTAALLTWKGPITNDAPVATVSDITGSDFLNVGSSLTGNYVYSDYEGDIQSGSSYQWYISGSLAGAYSPISGETGISHVIADSEQGKYFKFYVIPRAATGTITGTVKTSAGYGPVNTEPYADNVSIPGTPSIGSTLTGGYDYHDVDGDTQGTTTFRWLRNGVPVYGAVSDTYDVTFYDEGYKLAFEVTPVSSTGLPAAGTPVSVETAAVYDPSAELPVASEVCIEGVRAEGQTLKGKYRYDYHKAEGISTYRWLSGGIPITGASGTEYTLSGTDISGGEEITFEVTPVSSNIPPKTGMTAVSQPLARITLAEDNFSLADPEMILTANEGGGLFSGPGVVSGVFYPDIAGSDGSPHTINYLLNIVNSSTTCSQTATDSIIVIPIDSYFTSFKNYYCHDQGPDTIYVVNVPATASDRQFRLSNPDGIISQINDTTVVIDPLYMRPGNKKDTLFYSFLDGGSIFPISRAFVIDSVGTNISLVNLNDAYCDGSVKRYITVEGTYPGGGTGTWTGTLISEGEATSAFVNPSAGTAGSSYPVTYQYKSPTGCKSIILTDTVKINPLPNTDFILNPTYNIDGGSKELDASVSGGTFIGPGVLDTIFYPNIAGQGVHEIKYYITDVNGCSSNTSKTTTVRKVEGIYNNLPSVICYLDTVYNVYVNNLPDGISIVDFTNSKNSLIYNGDTSALYNPSLAGSGYDTIRFTYEWGDVMYALERSIYIDSIGKVAVTGLKDNYCDYEGTVSLRVFVENSTGNGNFAFSGPDTSFINYGNIADFYPSKTPTSLLPYVVSFTHVSNVQNSGCKKTVDYEIHVNKSPFVNITTSRTSINYEEAPILLEGIPSDGAFNGKGVYLQDTSYVFNPGVAGLGDIEIMLTYVDSLGCYAADIDTLHVAFSVGTIEGINSNSQYCYDGPDDTLQYVSESPWTSGQFFGDGLTNLPPDKALFDPDAAGKGDHHIFFRYSDLDGTVFEVSATLKVDSIGQVKIFGLNPGDIFCNNDASVQLSGFPQGGVFSGPVTDDYFVPSKGSGNTSVKYTYVNSSTGCSGAISIPVLINAAPVVSFMPEDRCIISDIDSTKYINSTTPVDSISTWLWEFADAFGSKTSDLREPKYLYTTGGLHKVTLSATTFRGCKTTKEETFDIGVKPFADFTWKNECYHENDSLLLFDATTSSSLIISRSWNFFDDDSLQTVANPKYPKKTTGYQPVEYIVKTNYEECHDTIYREIYIRPTIRFAGDNYFEDFEDGPGGWVKDYASLNNWIFGTPDRPVINSASSGTNAWYTQFEIGNQDVESSAVVSPCFDFTEIERPVISFDVWKRFDRNRDGAVLQYKIGDSGIWEPVGTFDDGINWFNSVQIKGRPGGDLIGWTSMDAMDTGWSGVRHTLDDLEGKTDIKFRIAYGSEGNTTDNDGFAFDDIRIGERTRNVLLEHFTNNKSEEGSLATQMVNNIVLSNEKDIINIQYHTNFPGTDAYYNDNPGDASARILFYGLTRIPYSFVDGGTNDDDARVYDYVLADITINDLRRRTMVNPYFRIDLNSSVYGGVLTVNGELTALEPVDDAENLTLYLAVTEKENTEETGAAGETIFYNIFRKFIPDAGGITLNKTWNNGDTYVIPDQTWVVENITDSGDIEVIAFIQNNITKEIYQAASQKETEVAVGVRETPDASVAGFIMYPNPAVNKLTVKFSDPLSGETVVTIIDIGGKPVREYKAGRGMTELLIDNLDLKGGIYFVRVSAKEIDLGYQKLVVSGN